MSLITLLTDFGYQEPFVGVMKGLLLSQCDESLRIVDLSHDIPPQDVKAAAFWLAQSYHYFPAGSIHVCVVDPGVGSTRRILVAESEDHRFVAPDNGVLTHVLKAGKFVVRCIESWPRSEPGSTFDGRDVFAPVAAQLASGKSAQELGPVVHTWEQLLAPSVKTKNGVSVGEVEVIDRFGNLITSIEAGGRVRRVSIHDQEVPWGSCYAAVPKKQLVALRNAWGRVEIALREGSASEALNCKVGTRVRVEFHD